MGCFLAAGEIQLRMKPGVDWHVSALVNMLHFYTPSWKVSEEMVLTQTSKSTVHTRTVPLNFRNRSLLVKKKKCEDSK